MTPFVASLAEIDLQVNLNYLYAGVFNVADEFHHNRAETRWKDGCARILWRSLGHISR